MSVTDPTDEHFKGGIWGWVTDQWVKLGTLAARLGVGIWGWDGFAWQKLPLLWGYSDVYQEREFDTGVSEGTHSLVFSTVPAGEIWVIHHVSASANTAGPELIGLYAYVDGGQVILAMELYLLAYDLVKWTGHVVLKEGDRIGAIFDDCAAGDDIQADAAGYKMNIAEDGDGVAAEEYVCVRDKKAQGTPGGTFSAGAWRPRDINDEQADAAEICSIASNRITLEGGAYHCLISSPAKLTGSHQARLYNVSDASVVLVGTSEYMATNISTMTRSFIVGRFVLASQKTLEVQHRSAYTSTTYGFGEDANFTDEIYTVAEFWREA